MGPRLLEENCENPEFCLVYEEEEIIDEADQKAIYVEEEMGCVMVWDASYQFDRWPLHLTLSTWRGATAPIPSS